jgi:hypothetical protein
MSSDLVKKKIRNEIKKCEYSATIHLASYQLHEFPSKFLFTTSLLFDIRSSLKVLNLSYNNITLLPDSIGELTELKELWLQSNPIESLPISLSNCYKLEILDLQRTKIRAIPSEFCNLKRLHELNYCETPYAIEISRRYQLTPTSLTGLKILKEALENEFQRKCLKETILNKLLGELYMKEADDPNTKVVVEQMVEVRHPCLPPLFPPLLTPAGQQLNQEFTDLEEFRLFSRRADKLLPESISEIDEEVLSLPPSPPHVERLPSLLRPSKTIPRTKEKFISMRDNTKRDRMAADVEIKVSPLPSPSHPLQLRSIYFDRIEREDVESTIRSIFQSVQSLEDMQFFVKYASQVCLPSFVSCLPHLSL